MPSRSRRVLALVGEGSKPARSLEGLAEEEIATWSMEYDVLTALEELGHTVVCLETGHDLTRIRDAIEEHRPQIVFNMLEDFHGQVVFDSNVVAYLELLRIPYTGCNPRGLLLSRDKALTKKICTYHRIRVPRFAVFRRGKRLRKLRRLDYPVIVKGLLEDSSMGISQASVVHDDVQLEKRIQFMHDTVGDHAIVEEFIDGREIYLGILGNERLETFPPWELNLDTLPEGVPRIATERIKHDLEFQQKHRILSGPARPLPEGVEAKMVRVGKRVFKLLGLNGYARMDFRLRQDGKLFLLEANANCDLTRDEDLGSAAHAAGVSYESLIQRIVNLGLRYYAAFE